MPGLCLDRKGAQWTEMTSSVQTLVTQRRPTSKSLSFSLYLHVESSWLASSLTRLFDRGDPRVDEKDLCATASEQLFIAYQKAGEKDWQTWDSGFLQPDVKKHQCLDEAALQDFVVAIRFVSVFPCHGYISSCWCVASQERGPHHHRHCPLQTWISAAAALWCVWTEWGTCMWA